MQERDAEDKYLQRIVELHELFDAMADLIYQNVNQTNSIVRYKEQRKKFCIALIKLGIVK